MGSYRIRASMRIRRRRRTGPAALPGRSRADTQTREPAGVVDNIQVKLSPICATDPQLVSRFVRSGPPSGVSRESDGATRRELFDTAMAFDRDRWNIAITHADLGALSADPNMQTVAAIMNRKA